MSAFISQAKNIGLAYDVDFHVAPSDIATPALHASLLQHFTNQQLAFSSTTPHLSPSRSSASPADIQTWNLLYTGKSQRASHLGALLNIYKRSIGQLTYKELVKESNKWPSYVAGPDNIERKVVFISKPRFFSITIVNSLMAMATSTNT